MRVADLVVDSLFAVDNRADMPALCQAHNALMLGVTSSSLAAAANLLLSPHTHAMYAIAGDR